MNKKPLPGGRNGQNRFGGSYEYDVTVSYAGQQMKTIVAPLCREMKKYGLRYFVAREQIEWGENITTRISEALVRSRYVLAIISEHYISRPWTIAEMNATLYAQISGSKILLLPLLVGKEEEIGSILQQLPLLRDCKYLRWENNARDIVLALVERVIKSSYR